jgi:hypothetical protein
MFPLEMVGGIWHADPRLYDPEDILFFKFKTSRKEWKNPTARDVWKKDRLQHSYLKSKGYTVIRFWEKEIECDIDSCIQIIKGRIQECKNKQTKTSTFQHMHNESQTE